MGYKSLVEGGVSKREPTNHCHQSGDGEGVDKRYYFVENVLCCHFISVLGCHLVILKFLCCLDYFDAWITTPDIARCLERSFASFWLRTNDRIFAVICNLPTRTNWKCKFILISWLANSPCLANNYQEKFFLRAQDYSSYKGCSKIWQICMTNTKVMFNGCWASDGRLISFLKLSGLDESS